MSTSPNSWSPSDDALLHMVRNAIKQHGDITNEQIQTLMYNTTLAENVPLEQIEAIRQRVINGEYPSW